MQALESKLNAIREDLGSKLPQEVKDVMARAGQQLADSGILDGVVKVGEKAPDFELRNANGETFELSALLKRGPVVLNFYRGDWCPFCNAELEAIAGIHDEIKQLGAELVAVCPQQGRFLEKARRTTKIGCELLGDPGNELAASYGVKYEVTPDLQDAYRGLGIDLEQANADNSWTLPLPARFIIDTSGVIRDARVNIDYSQRPEPQQALEVLRSLR